ncbi:MAG: M56 family metallopeptidase, partial [Verrucomicrobiota bacterium]
MNSLTLFLSHNLIDVTIRYSLLIVLMLGLLRLLPDLPSHFRARIAALAVISISLIGILKTGFPSIEFAVLPEKAPTVFQGDLQTSVLISEQTESLIGLDNRPLAAPNISDASPAAINLLALLWFVGMTGFLLHWLIGQIQLSLLIRASEKQPAGKLREYLESICQSEGIDKNVRLYLSEETTLPFCGGFFRRSIVLPKDANHWSSERLIMILRHELAHIKNGDLLIQPFVNWSLALQWFNPVAWFAYRLYSEERENACDDFVLHRGLSASSYSACLVDFLKEGRAGKSPRLSCLEMASAGSVEKRLRSILDSDRNRNNSRFLSKAIACTVFLTVILGAGLISLEARPSIVRSSIVPSSEQIAMDTETIDKPSVEISEENALINGPSKIKISTKFIRLPKDHEIKFSGNDMIQSLDGGVIAIEDEETISKLISDFQQHDNFNLLAAPTVSLVDGKTAAIEVTQDLRYPDFHIDGKTQTLIRRGFLSKDIGPKLKVTPKIDENGSIAIQAKVTLTEFLGFIELGPKQLRPGFKIAPDLLDEEGSGSTSFLFPMMRTQESDSSYPSIIPGGSIVKIFPPSWGIDKVPPSLLDAFDIQEDQIGIQHDSGDILVALITPEIIEV